MFIINVINSIPSPNTHMVNIIFANILIIVIILSVKRTTINGITTTRRGHDLGFGRDCSRSCSRGCRDI